MDRKEEVDDVRENKSFYYGLGWPPPLVCLLCAHGKRTHAANQILFAESKHVDQTESGPVSSAIKSVSCESKQIEGRRSHSTKESERLFPSHLFLAGQKKSLKKKKKKKEE